MFPSGKRTPNWSHVLVLGCSPNIYGCSHIANGYIYERPSLYSGIPVTSMHVPVWQTGSERDKCQCTWVVPVHIWVIPSGKRTLNGLTDWVLGCSHNVLG